MQICLKSSALVDHYGYEISALGKRPMTSSMSTRRSFFYKIKSRPKPAALLLIEKIHDEPSPRDTEDKFFFAISTASFAGFFAEMA